MAVRKILKTAVLVTSLGVVVGSCKDLGDELNTGLTASTFAVSLSPGESTTVIINGGHPPYRISRPPVATLASASLTNLTNGNGELVITAATTAGASGTTEVRVAESDVNDLFLKSLANSSNEIVIAIAVNVSPPAVSFSGQVQPMLTTNCSSHGCHPGSGAPFPLTTGQSYGNLVNIIATFAPCAGLPRVRPFSADSSVLYRRIKGTACGNQMPLGFPALSSAEQSLIQSWINQGAPNN
jgi:hypothetical protein